MSSPPAQQQLLQTLVWNLEAELATLGGVMVDGLGAGTMCSTLQTEGLKREHFYLDSHAILWDAMVALDASGHPIDLVSLADYLRRSGDLDVIGGMEKVSNLMSAVPSAANTPFYASLVRDAYARRSAQMHASAVLDMASTATHEELLTQFEDASAVIYSQSAKNDPPMEIKMAMREEYTTLERKFAAISTDGSDNDAEFSRGIPTRMTGFDKKFGRYRRGRLIIVAARPGVGKSAYATQTLIDFGRAKCPSTLFTLEMTRPQTTRRILSQETGIAIQKIEDARLDEPDWPVMIEATKGVAGLPIWIDHRKHALPMLRAEIRRMVREHGIKAVFIDFIQKVKNPLGKFGSNREQELAGVSGALQELAQSLNLAMIVFAQLSRPPKGGTPRKPDLPDLRESGAIEIDADGVIFIHRNPDPDAKSEDQETTEFIIRKNRDGDTGPSNARFNRKFVRFEEDTPAEAKALAKAAEKEAHPWAEEREEA